MLRVVLRVVVFAVVVVLTFFVEAFVTVVFITHEVSCYRQCSAGTEFLEDTAPLPGVLGTLVALAAGWGASRLLRKRSPA